MIFAISHNRNRHQKNERAEEELGSQYLRPLLATPVKLYAIQKGRVDAGEHPPEDVGLTRPESSKRPYLCGHPQAAPLAGCSPLSRD
jgi:hypothetical protein